jgi:hypothetical protein
VKLKLAGDGKCFDIFGDRDYAQSSANGNGTLKLSAYGYRWLEVVPGDGDASSARTRRGEGKRPAKAQ